MGNTLTTLLIYGPIGYTSLFGFGPPDADIVAEHSPVVNPCEYSALNVVVIEPPPAWCCKSAWGTANCDVIQNAVDAAPDGTLFKIKTGNYCNEDYYLNYGLGAEAAGKTINNGNLLEIDGRTNLQFAGVDENGNCFAGTEGPDDKPQLLADGSNAIKISNNSSHINIIDLTFVGTNLNINGVEATANRQSITGRIEGGANNGQDTGCFVYKSQGDCPTAWNQSCRWSSSKSECLGKNYAYYSG